MISLIALLMLFAGIMCWGLALYHRTEAMPSLRSASTYHPRNWLVSPKTLKQWFSPKGYRYYWTGAILIGSTGILRILFYD